MFLVYLLIFKVLKKDITESNYSLHYVSKFAKFIVKYIINYIML